MPLQMYQYQPYYAMLDCTYSMHACKPYNGMCAAGFAVRTLICKKIGHTDDKTGMDAVWGKKVNI